VFLTFNCDEIVILTLLPEKVKRRNDRKCERNYSKTKEHYKEGYFSRDLSTVHILMTHF